MAVRCERRKTISAQPCEMSAASAHGRELLLMEPVLAVLKGSPDRGGAPVTVEIGGPGAGLASRRTALSLRVIRDAQSRKPDTSDAPSHRTEIYGVLTENAAGHAFCRE